MNIFVLHTNPNEAAKMHCDKHVVKMILESVQMLSTVAGMGYKATHQNHPCTLWVKQSKQNYEWLCQLVEALHSEWQWRYNRTYKHKSYIVYEGLVQPELPDIGLTPFAQAMPEYLRDKDAVTAYRNYYKTEKANILSFTKRPDWTKEVA